MPLLLVAYDLNKPEQDHTELLEQIKRYSNVRLTESSFAIITDETPKTVCGKLNKFINNGDNIYVITLKRPYDTCKPNLASDWLNKELTQ
jgi:hypothetical protein